MKCSVGVNSYHHHHCHLNILLIFWCIKHLTPIAQGLLLLISGFFHILLVMCVLCLVTQLCPTLCNTMDCSLLGSSVHGDSPGKNTGENMYTKNTCPPPRYLPNPGIEHRSTTWQVDSLPCKALGKPNNSGVGSLSML